MKWPAKIKTAIVYEEPVISLDIFGTVAHYANADTKNPLDGVNLLPFITGENSGAPHEFLFWRQFDNKSYAVRGGDMKLVNVKATNDELYNLTEDIGERQIIESESELENLMDAKNAWTENMIDPIFLGLMQDEEYTKLHPDRFKVEKY